MGRAASPAATGSTGSNGLNAGSNLTANYGTGFTYRGNVTRRVANGRTTNISYDITGAVTSANDGLGHTVAVDPATGTNNAAPGLITPNGNSNLAETLAYNAFLGVTSDTGPNGAQASVNYDAYMRPSSSVSVDGASTTYSYVTAAPASTTATTNGRWVKSTYDGLGRTVKVESGDGSGTKSIVDTEYASCACSPLGKMKRVSQPYAPGGTVYWTTYVYDGLGRTSSVTLADSSEGVPPVVEG